MTTARLKMEKILKDLTIEKLIETWEGIDKEEISSGIANVREVLANELEKRDPEAMDKWFDEECEEGKNLSPRKFFIK